MAMTLHFEGMSEWATEDKLVKVRELRGSDPENPICSLRSVAAEMARLYPDYPWSPDWNQLAGVDLCRLAGVDAG